jgi:hypothetical protein
MFVVSACSAFWPAQADPANAALAADEDGAHASPATTAFSRSMIEN